MRMIIRKKTIKWLSVLVQITVILNVSFFGVLMAPTDVSAMSTPGSIWTTKNDCGSESQDVNEFNAGEHVYINGNGFAAGTYDWYIVGQPASSDPDIQVATGTKSVDSSGKFCFDAYLVLSGDDGVYKTNFNGKNDNYHVNGVTSLENPDLENSCGIDIALVLDSSGSIDDIELGQMRTSFKDFVDSFLPNTPTQFSIIDFDFTGNVISVPAFSNNATSVKSYIDSPSIVGGQPYGGATNWEDALAVAQSTFDPRPSVPNLIILASDGNPTVNNGPGGEATNWMTDNNDLTRAIIQANNIKDDGIRIITLGIGSSVEQANLEAISGSAGSSAYFSAANFSELASALHDITSALCGGTITVNKVIDADGNLETIEDQTPGAGWEFTVVGETKTTDENGQTLPKDVDSGSYNITETVKQGYELVDADCNVENSGLDGETLYAVQVGDSDVVNCTFYNKPLPGTLTVIKHVNNTYQGTAVAADFTIEVSTGTSASFSGSETGVLVTIPAGASFNVSETDGPQGYAATYIGDCSGTMPLAGQKTCTVVNDQLDPHADEGMITVIKNVVNDNGGTAEASAFTLYVNDTTVTGGASNYYPVGDYTVSESALSGYQQTGIVCRDGEAIVSETGSITLSAGQAITCTITNDDIQPKLTVVKQVVGGTAQISDFPLYVALGQNTPAAVTSGVANDFDAGDYTVSEINQPNYVASWNENCSNGEVSLAVGDDKTCTITNTYTFVPTYSVHGIKWNDANGNGERDCDEQSCEAKLSGWTIFIDEDGNKQLDEGERSFVTSSDDSEDFGWYWFDNLPSDDYMICEVQQNGWTQTYPAEGRCHDIYLPNDSEQSVNSVVGPQYDFGNRQDEVQQCTGSGTYTVNADFDKGNLINVNHSTADQLQLSDQVNAFNFIWVSVSGKGTMVKINTDTGAVVGEYYTAPTSQGNGNTSRTTVDKDGSVWVANRNAVYYEDGYYYGSVAHIGLVENGQCEDRNGNGVIDTSIGQGDIKPWADATGDRHVATAQDECIVHYVKTSNSDARHISVTADNNVWVSGIGGRNFDLIKGGKWNTPGSGNIIRHENGVGYGGYGGLITSGGVIWSANPLIRWDTAYPLTSPQLLPTGTSSIRFSHSDSYGLCIDHQGNVWNTGLSDGQIRKFALDGTLLGTFSYHGNNAQGCAVDQNDNVWVAHSLWGNSVGHLLNDGTWVGNIAVGSGPTGLSVDANNKVWVTMNNSPYVVMRIDPTLGALGTDGVTKIGAVDFTSGDLGGNLYNYSDMTGSTLSGKAESGTWTVIHDGTVADYPWKNISWTADLNGGSLSVTVATSDDGLTFGAPQAITNGQDLSSLTSRYLKIVVSFDRSESGNSPVLYDLSVNRDCGETPPPPPPPVCTSNCGGGGGGSSILPYLQPAVLGETLKPVLVLTKTATQDTIYAGAKNLEFSLIVTNTGNASGLDIKIEDQLPAGMTFSGGKDTTRAWTIAELKPGESKTFTYRADSAVDLKAGSYVNTATLTASNFGTLEAKADVEVREPQVLGEKLIETGFAPRELIFLLILLFSFFASSLVLKYKHGERV